MKKIKVQKFTSFTLAVVMMFGLFAGVLHTALKVSASAGNANFTSVETQAQYNGFITGPKIGTIPPDAIHIKTAEELAQIGGSQSADKYYVLDNNIELMDEWIPINDFRGTFDGRGHSINNLYILQNSNREYAGLFGWINDDNEYEVLIKNVGVNIGTQGVYSFGYAGGLIGSNVTGIITNCYTTGNVFASSSSVTAVAVAGGLIGENSGIITNCYTTGTVFASSPFIAGAGGISGSNGFSTAAISNCYNIGNITAFSSGFAEAGGICAVADFGVTHISNSYCLDLYDSEFGTQLTAAQMQTQSSFAGFDFDNVWTIDPDVNSGYPYLIGMPLEAVKTSNKAQELVDFALSFTGHTRSEINAKLTNSLVDSHWCVSFVSRCAAEVGLSEIIPYLTWSPDMWGSVKGERLRYDETPQIGDIIFFNWNGDRIPNNHVGIVCDVDETYVYVVHGNYHTTAGGGYKGSCVCAPPGPWGVNGEWVTCKFHSGSQSGSDKFTLNHQHIAGYIRPDYDAIPNVSGTITYNIKCPVNVQFSLRGEELDSAANKLTASFGYMEITGDSVKVVVNYGNVYGIVVTGYDEGKMNLTIEYDTNIDQNTRQFIEVPITPDTIIDIYSSSVSAGTELIVTTDNRETIDTAWYATGGETVNAPNSEMTYELQNPSYPDEEIIKGDLNGDGAADIKDAQFYLEYLVGNTTLTPAQIAALRLAAADYDNDDSAIRKLRKFLQFILQSVMTE